MAFGIVDTRIKRILREYRETGSSGSWDRLVHSLSPAIISYPRKAHYRSRDECSDFYCYMLERLPGILKNYKENRARFSTWFYVVLRNRYLNWTEKNRGGLKFISSGVSRAGQGDLTDAVQVKKWKETGSRTPDRTLFRLEKALNKLRPKERILVKLLFFELDAGDLVLMGREKDAGELYERYLACRQKMERSAGIRQRRIRTAYSQLYALMEKCRAEPENRGWERLAEEKKANIRKHERDFFSQKFHMPYDWISAVTGWPVHSIKHRVATIRKTLTRYLT